MKKVIVFGGLALAAMAAASPASAQSVSGTVTLTGTVGAKCIVTNPGASASPDFGGTINLGQLDNPATGTLATIAPVSSASNTNLNFRVVCTTANPLVSVTATPLTTGAVASTGYTNTVHYTSNVTFSTTGAPEVKNVTTDAIASVGPVALANRLATGGNNINVAANTFHTAGASDVLLAGTYTGTISITVAPGT